MKQQHLLSGTSQPTRLPLQIPQESVEMISRRKMDNYPLLEGGRRGGLVGDSVL
jgi:hypothetical protein